MHKHMFTRVGMNMHVYVCAQTRVYVCTDTLGLAIKVDFMENDISPNALD